MKLRLFIALMLACGMFAADLEPTQTKPAGEKHTWLLCSNPPWQILGFPSMPESWTKYGVGVSADKLDPSVTGMLVTIAYRETVDGPMLTRSALVRREPMAPVVCVMIWTGATKPIVAKENIIVQLISD